VQIALALFDQFTALDAVGPYQVLGSLPGAEVVPVAASAGRVRDDTALVFDVEATFDDVRRPDVVVVPGGLVTRRMVRDGHPVIDWLRAVHPTTTWTTSVCTGAVLLGAAGALEGLEATTHWSAYEQLRALGARPTSQRVVVQGKVVTGAGVSAGIDMALTLVELMAGRSTAQAIQLGIEYDPQPPVDAGSPAKAPAEVHERLARRFARLEDELMAR
jgi:transcriptional regulator GlxA family with amidase domain